MIEIKNINKFIDDLSITGDTPLFYNELVNFTRSKKEIRDSIKDNSFISKENSGYSIKYNARKIFFSCLSDKNISVYDRNKLESQEEIDDYLIRPIKLAFHMDLAYSKVIFASSNIRNSSLLISYLTKNGTKIIDYYNNLIMDKNDYYEIFKVLEINEMDRPDIYKISNILDLCDYNNNLLYFLLAFSSDFIKAMDTLDPYKFDNKGFNKRNAYLLDGDEIFFYPEDFNHEYDSYIEELNNFTLNPQVLTKHITKNNNKYKFTSKKISFEFSLLSDNIIKDEITSPKLDELLNEDRYGYCNENAHFIAFTLGLNREDVFIVSGKCKLNEIDYYYHTLVEDEYFVYDYNNNIIMNKSDYYKLYEVEVLNKTSTKEMQDIIKVVMEEAQLSFEFAILLNYFGKELKNDILKSRVLR